jgi:hypothetical protein
MSGPLDAKMPFNTHDNIVFKPYEASYEQSVRHYRDVEEIREQRQIKKVEEARLIGGAAYNNYGKPIETVGLIGSICDIEVS